jgi:hypothetical protein
MDNYFELSLHILCLFVHTNAQGIEFALSRAGKLKNVEFLIPYGKNVVTTNPKSLFST